MASIWTLYPAFTQYCHLLSLLSSSDINGRSGALPVMCVRLDRSSRMYFAKLGEQGHGVATCEWIIGIMPAGPARV